MNEDVKRKQILNVLSAVLNYFMEDTIVLTLNYNWLHSYSSDDIYKSYMNNSQINLGLTYYIDKGMLIK